MPVRPDRVCARREELRYIAVPALEEGHTVLLKMVAHTLAFAVLLGLLLFLPAGTMAWPQAWVFMALFIGSSEAIGVWLGKSDPDLLAERMKSPLSADQKLNDRVVVGAIIVVFFGWIIFMAFDARRFGWSHTPWWAQTLGAALIGGLLRVGRGSKGEQFCLGHLARSGGTWPDGHLDRPLRGRAASDVHL